jgi:hypothetical protein
MPSPQIPPAGDFAGNLAGNLAGSLARPEQSLESAASKLVPGCWSLRRPARAANGLRRTETHAVLGEVVPRDW